jgi:hypothetical protein
MHAPSLYHTHMSLARCFVCIHHSGSRLPSLHVCVALVVVLLVCVCVKERESCVCVSADGWCDKIKRT